MWCTYFLVIDYLVPYSPLGEIGEKFVTTMNSLIVKFEDNPLNIVASDVAKVQLHAHSNVTHQLDHNG